MVHGNLRISPVVFFSFLAAAAYGALVEALEGQLILAVAVAVGNEPGLCRLGLAVLSLVYLTLHSLDQLLFQALTLLNLSQVGVSQVAVGRTVSF